MRDALEETGKRLWRLAPAGVGTLVSLKFGELIATARTNWTLALHEPPPAWLTEKVLAPWVQPLLAAIIAASLAWALWPVVRGALGWIASLIRSKSKLSGTDEPPAIAPPAQPSLVIDVHYGSMFSISPREGPRSIAQLHPINAEGGGGGLGIFTPGPGASDDNWMRSPKAYRCEAINYGTAPLLGVELVLTVQFRQSIPEGNARHQGAPVFTGPWPIKISHLGVGPDHKATFYLENIARDAFAEIGLPATATATAVGGSELSLSVTSTAKHGLLLGPREEAAPEPQDAVSAPAPPDASQFTSELDQHAAAIRSLKLYEKRDAVLAEITYLLEEGYQVMNEDMSHYDWPVHYSMWRSNLEVFFDTTGQLIPGLKAEIFSGVTGERYEEIGPQILANLNAADDRLRWKLQDLDNL